ncbi:MAG: hypothetical protein ACI8YQ_000757 [Polaribacter sp.]|jgi:hypothetical protein
MNQSYRKNTKVRNIKFLESFFMAFLFAFAVKKYAWRSANLLAITK